MRVLLPFLAILCLGACGAEDTEYELPLDPYEAERGQDATAGQGRQSGSPVLTGRKTQIEAWREERVQAIFSRIQANKHVRESVRSLEFEILRHADRVRLCVGSVEELDSEKDLVVLERTGERAETGERLLKAISRGDGRITRCFRTDATLEFCRGGQCVEVEVCVGCGMVHISTLRQGKSWEDAVEERSAWGTLDGSFASTLRGLCRKYGLGEFGGCGGSGYRG